MLEIFLSAVFSYCTFQLAIKKDRQIDYSILYFKLVLGLSSKRHTRVYVWVFCGYFFACCWINNKAMKYWHMNFLHLFTFFFSEKMNLIPNQTITAATLFEVFWWWINIKKMPIVSLWSTCIRVPITWIKILLMGRSGLFTPLWQFSMYNNHFGNQNKYKILA